MTLFTADYGGNRFHVFDSDRDVFHEKLRLGNFINLDVPNLGEGDTLVVECAHLREWHKNTMAQPLKYDELTQFKKNCDEKGVTVKLFPQNSSPKARKLHGYEVEKDNAKFKRLYGISTDEADTRSMANLLLNDENVLDSLKEFFPTRMEDFQDKSDPIFKLIQEANEDINPAKSQGYGFSTKEEFKEFEDEVSKWIVANLDKIIERFDNDPDVMNLLGIIRLKPTKKNPDGKLKVKTPSRIYTLTTTILRPDGSLRKRHDNGLPPYWQYVKAHLLGCKPFHSQQGVISSNYKHWIRPNVSEYNHPDKISGNISKNSSDIRIDMGFEELANLKKARTKVDKLTQKVWYVLREMIVGEGRR